MRRRPNFAEVEALALLRTFVAGPATAQWAAVGEAPAPQLNDRSRPRPQRGNSRERLTPPAAHHERPLHVLEAGRRCRRRRCATREWPRGPARSSARRRYTVADLELRIDLNIDLCDIASAAPSASHAAPSASHAS